MLDDGGRNWRQVRVMVPRQKNEIDCGVFLCYFALCAVRRLTVDMNFCPDSLRKTLSTIIMKRSVKPITLD